MLITFYFCLFVRWVQDFFHEYEDDVHLHSANSTLGYKEVDLVLSTTELLALMEMRMKSFSLEDPSIATKIDFLRRWPADVVHGRDEIEALFRSASADGEALNLAVETGGGSGGFLEHICRYAAHTLLGLDLWDRPLPYERLRNGDMEEVVVDPGDGRTPLRFAKSYGFRNIQSVMLSLRRGLCTYDFVEVMACPSGCLNGGGQLRLEESTISEDKSASHDTIHRINTVFHAVRPRRPEDGPLARWLYCHDRLGKPLSSLAMDLCHTRYHVVPKLEVLSPAAARW